MSAACPPLPRKGPRVGVRCAAFAAVLSAVAAVPRVAPAQEAPEARSRAAAVLEQVGLRRGICAVVGCDERFPIELALASELLVHVRDPERKAVAELRTEAAGAGLGIDRLAAETGTFAALPYAGQLADAVVTSRAERDALGALAASEVLRVLRPGGRAVLAGSPSAALDERLDALARAAREAGAVRIERWASAGARGVRFERPPLEGMDDWSHWEKGPDNNPVSNDRHIRAPYLTQFFAGPLYIGMPSVTTAAGGRTFLAIGHIAHHRREWDTLLWLIARDGYNGSVLWTRKLPDGYRVHRSAFVATAETFHLLDGNRCLLLDAATGAEKGEIRLPGVAGEWKWMALEEGTLFVLAGPPDPPARTMRGDRSFGGWSWDDLSPDYYIRPRIPAGFGTTLAALDLDGGELRWRHDGEAPIDSRALAVRDGRVYLYAPEKHLRALHSGTGEVLWTNGDAEVLGLIESPGRGLTSTPGFRTACMTVATPEALVIQGQTRMNVIGISTGDGRLLWVKKKVTNNPNAIYTDGRVILGVGPGGSHVAIDPASGDVLEDLSFRKANCTRLTASPDSFFCRGEGTLRFDRARGKVLIDGGIRPACNDGALPANGLLYIGPWQCDCNLSTIGHIARCPAGDFRFDHVATEAERLERHFDAGDEPGLFEVTENDWPTYRRDNSRSGGTSAAVAPRAARRWQFRPDIPSLPAAPVAAGGLIFTAGKDGQVRAISGETGTLRWELATGAPVLYPPSIWDGRAFAGSGDGWMYCIEAATGELLWRFRAAPLERTIPVYGTLASTWPVNSGVLIHEGTAYFAAGIVDQDGTYVYALDAATGGIRWQNGSSGHLHAELRKGVSVQGNLTAAGDHLLLAGGNQVSPARYRLADGACVAPEFSQGHPKANAGRFTGAFRGDVAIQGGLLLYSGATDVATKSGFVAFSGTGTRQVSQGGVPPAWDGDTFVLVNQKHGRIFACDAAEVHRRLTGERDTPDRRRRPRWLANLATQLEDAGALRWQSDLGEAEGFEVLSLAVAENAVVAVVTYQEAFRAQPECYVAALAKRDGTVLWRHRLPGPALREGLLVDRAGQTIVSLLDGTLIAFGPGGRG